MSTKPVRWRCRRGMKELDVLLERYLERHYPAADARERAVLDRLLEVEDPDLHAWCMGRVAPPDEFRPLIEKLRRAA